MLPTFGDLVAASLPEGNLGFDFVADVGGAADDAGYRVMVDRVESRRARVASTSSREFMEFLQTEKWAVKMPKTYFADATLSTSRRDQKRLAKAKPSGGSAPRRTIIRSRPGTIHRYRENLP